MSPRFVSLTLMVTSFTLPSAALLAAPVEEAPSLSVSFADLNLSSPAGEAALKTRIAAAATAMCGQPDIRDVAAFNHATTCKRAAIASANPQIEVAMANAQKTQRYAQASSTVRTGAR